VLEIGKYRFKRKNVAMDIGKDRDTHDGTIPSCAKATATRRSHLNPSIENRHPRLHRAPQTNTPSPTMAKSADEILSAVKRFCQRAQNTFHSEL
jgi:hypothetical protein